MRSSKARAAPGKLAPGRTSKPEDVKRWTAEIVAFLRLVQENELNVHGAAKIALLMSDESIAFLAFKARDLFIQAAARSRETPPRKRAKSSKKLGAMKRGSPSKGTNGKTRRSLLGSS
jgi:hypothetical protein